MCRRSQRVIEKAFVCISVTMVMPDNMDGATGDAPAQESVVWLLLAISREPSDTGLFYANRSITLNGSTAELAYGPDMSFCTLRELCAS